MSFTTPIHTNEQSIDRVLQTGVPTLLVFWRSRDCAPCAQLNPILDRLAAAYAGKVIVAKVDATDNGALLRRYDVTQLPDLIFVRDGDVVSHSVGAATEQGLKAWVDGLVRGASPTPPTGPSVPVAVAGWTQGMPRPSPAPQSPAAGPAPGAAHAAATDGRHPVVLTDQTFEKIVGQSDRPVLVDFWAPWCGPCRMVAPIVEQLANEFKGRAIVAKLNVDENPAVSQRFGISSIPALFIFRRGQVVERLVGARPASALRAALEKHCRG